jgi:hypothetical protein
MTEFVELISGGHLLLVLLFTAMICVVLGLGLPTTANYIVVSTLMAPVIVTLAANSGLAVPLIAVHLFVFYFGILADDTPPVGLAAYAAAAISRADPIKTGVQGFMYDIRTAVLPFMFIFNTELIMVGIDSVWHLLLTVASATSAMLVFAAATQGYFFAKSRLWESGILLLAAFTLFRPGFWMDSIFPPTERIEPAQVLEIVAERPADARLRVVIEGEAVSGEHVRKTVDLPLGAPGTGPARMQSVGLELRIEDGQVWIDNVVWGSFAEKQGLEFDWKITSVELPLEQPSKYWMCLPALLAIGAIAALHRRRVALAAAPRQPAPADSSPQ